jgi:hypothetical protein
MNSFSNRTFAERVIERCGVMTSVNGVLGKELNTGGLSK